MSIVLKCGLKPIVSLILLCALCASCGGPQAGHDSAAFPDSSLSAQLDAPQMLSVSKGKQASGLPAGIFVTWTRSESNLAAGYYLYRDTESIPDPPIGESLDPLLRVNDGNQIPQTPDGESITFNDLFDVEVGETYFYRVTVVDGDGLESDPSNEMSWTVHGHSVTGMAPTSAYWGDDIVLTGDTFGTYDAETDSVQFTGPSGTIGGMIIGWSDTEITARVPVDARTGFVGVVVDGTVANTDEVLTILNPIIESIDSSPAVEGADVTLSGNSFGATQSDSTLVWGGSDISGSITSWSDTSITFTMGAQNMRGNLQLSVGGEPSNNPELVLQPNILSASVPAQQSGELVTLSGTGFTDGAAAVSMRLMIDGSEELTVTEFSAAEIIFELEGSVGAHTLSAIREDSSGDVASEDFSFQILEPLSVTLGGVSSGDVLRPATPPSLSVATNSDAESITLLYDGAEIQTLDTAPFSGLDLVLGTRINGNHSVALRAERYGVVAESVPVGVTVYSLVGDIDADGSVGPGDSAALPSLIGLAAADGDYRLWYDTDEDGIVSEKDLAAVGYNFGDSVLALP